MNGLGVLYRRGLLAGAGVLLVACTSSPTGGPGGPAETGGEGGEGPAGASGSGGGTGTGGRVAPEGTGGSPSMGAPDAAAAIGDAAPEGSAADGAPTGPPAGAVPSPACAGGAMLPGPDGYQTIMVNGKARKFLVRVPKGYDGKTPQMLFFGEHGGGSNGSGFEGRIAALRKAIGDKAVYVYPDALSAGGMTTWSRDFMDDLAFHDAVLAWFKEKVCYDAARIVAFGQSSGAYMAHTLGCHRGSIFRAIASNGGGGRVNEFVNCLGEPVAAWISNGVMDAPHLVDAKRGRDGWLKFNGCSLENPAKVDPAPCISYAGCKPGFPLHYCENSGGHDIPGYAAAGVSAFFLGSFDK